MTNVTSDISDQQMRIALRSPEQNQDIYREFYKEYYPKIYSYCRMQTKSSKQAQQIAKKVFSQIHDKRHRIPSDGSFYAWIRQMTHTIIYNQQTQTSYQQ